MKKEIDSVYSHLLINRTKRAGLLFVLFATFILMAIILGKYATAKDASLFITVLVATAVGIPIVFYPPVEQWIYHPWQAKAQKYERHYKD